MEREQKMKHEKWRPRDEQRHARHSYASNNHHRGNQASFAGEMSDDVADGEPSSASSRHHDRTPHRTGAHKYNHHRRQHHEQGHASTARHGTATTMRHDDQTSFAQDLSFTHPSPSSGVDRHLCHGNNVTTGTTAPSSGEVSVRHGSFPSIMSVSRPPHNHHVHDNHAAAIQYGTPMSSVAEHGHSGREVLRNDHVPGNQSSVAHIVPVSRPPQHYPRTLVDDGDLKPSLPMHDQTMATAVSDNEEESFTDVEIGRNAVDSASLDAGERNLDEVYPPGEGREETRVHPGAIAVAGPGGANAAVNRSTRSSVSQQQQHDEDQIGTGGDLMVEAHLVVDDDQTLRYEQVERRIQERLDQRLQEALDNAAPTAAHAQVVTAENMQAQSNDPPGSETSGEIPHTTQQELDNCNERRENPIKSRRNHLCIAAVLVLVVAVVVMGVVLGRSNGGGSTDASQSSSTGGQDAPPTLDPTSRPEPTLPPTPPPTPPPTLPPTPAPDTPEQLKELITSVSFDGGAALQDASSPQSRALRWLQNNTDLAEYPDWRRIQRYVLSTLYYSTNGEAWATSTGWLSDSNECDWYEKNCGAATCHGQSVNTVCLHENGLKGRIPPELGLLSNSLDFFSLYANLIGGSMPSEIGLLPKINVLYLSQNLISGPIPSEIGLLSKLSIMYLWGNQISNRFPSELGLLSNMDYLTVSQNQISGPIPSEFGLLSKLSILRLWGNQISNVIPSELGLLSNLDTLSFSSNQIVGTLPTEIGLLKKMTYFDAFSNELSGTIPNVFGAMTNLDDLWLYDNDFTGEFQCPSFITNCTISCGSITSVSCRSL